VCEIQTGHSLVYSETLRGRLSVVYMQVCMLSRKQTTYLTHLMIRRVSAEYYAHAFCCAVLFSLQQLPFVQCIWNGFSESNKYKRVEVITIVEPTSSQLTICEIISCLQFWHTDWWWIL